MLSEILLKPDGEKPVAVNFVYNTLSIFYPGVWGPVLKIQSENARSPCGSRVYSEAWPPGQRDFASNIEVLPQLQVPAVFFYECMVFFPVNGLAGK
jgi:hypothetical protein